MFSSLPRKLHSLVSVFLPTRLLIYVLKYLNWETTNGELEKDFGRRHPTKQLKNRKKSPEGCLVVEASWNNLHLFRGENFWVKFSLISEILRRLLILIPCEKNSRNEESWRTSNASWQDFPKVDQRPCRHLWEALTSSCCRSLRREKITWDRPEVVN